MLKFKHLFWVLMMWLALVKLKAASIADPCSSFSSSDAENYWYKIIQNILNVFLILLILINRDAVGKCSICTSQIECGFCLSTLQCVSGVEAGPSSGLSCPNWVFSNVSCPGFFLKRNLCSTILK